MHPLIIPGGMALFTVFYPKTQRPLFESARVFAGAASAASLGLISWKVYAASIFLVGPMIAIASGVTIFGTYLCMRDLNNLRQRQFQPLPAEEHQD